MIFKTEIIWIGLGQFSVKVKNKTAKTDTDLNSSISNFYLSLKTITKVNRILLKKYLKLKY